MPPPVSRSQRSAYHRYDQLAVDAVLHDLSVSQNYDRSRLVVEGGKDRGTALHKVPRAAHCSLESRRWWPHPAPEWGVCQNSTGNGNSLALPAKLHAAFAGDRIEPVGSRSTNSRRYARSSPPDLLGVASGGRTRYFPLSVEQERFLKQMTHRSSPENLISWPSTRISLLDIHKTQKKA